MQPVYQALNPIDYDWQLIDSVYVPVWYNSLQLQTQEEIRIRQKTNYDIPTGTYFENEKKRYDMVSDNKFNEDSDIE